MVCRVNVLDVNQAAVSGQVVAALAVVAIARRRDWVGPHPSCFPAENWLTVCLPGALGK